MCSRFNGHDPKMRLTLFLANLSLSVGIALMLFVHPVAQHARNLVHFAGGMLLGISIAVNLASIGLRRRCVRGQA